MNTEKEKLSYTMGQQIGNGIMQDKIEVDTSALTLGLTHALEDKPSQLSADEMQAVLQNFQKQLQEKANSAQDENAQIGTDFLVANAEKEGVEILESGMQYIVLNQGDGPKPAPSDKVKVHYAGSLINGTEFDSSIKRGEPAVFPVTGVIQGWQEALQLMNVGSKWKVFIPSNLAYGSQGAGGSIGPNETLIFEMELLGIE